jgi:hypothetical protein
MLEIFRDFKEETSIFNDFEMYERPQKVSSKKKKKLGGLSTLIN